jgi:hypothetical protein
MPPEAQWISSLVNSGGILALVVILLRQQRDFQKSMEKRWDRISDVLSAFVEILSRIEVRVGVDIGRRKTPVPRPDRDTDPEDT